MSIFSINFDQFKPSNTLQKTLKALDTVTPSAQGNRSIPVTAPRATPLPSPTPAPAPQTRLPENRSGLQKILDALSYPSKLTERVLTGGKGYESAYSNPESFLRKADLGTRLITKITGKDPYADPKAGKIVSTANRFVLDPLNIIPFGAIGSAAGKAGRFVSKTTGLSKLGGNVKKLAKTTPLVYKAIEKVNPYFRNPEFGKVVAATEEATGTRISNLYRELKGMITGLTPEDQVHIGEVVEGIAKPSNQRAAQIAADVKRLGNEIGQEAVNVGLLSKKSFNKFKDNYLSHIFLDESKYAGTSIRDIPKVAGKMFKKRTGAEGYVKEFAPAVYKGLGSEIKDIESVKMFQTIADKFGEKIGRKAAALPGYVRASEVGIKGRSFAKAFAQKQIPQEIAEYLTKVRNVNPTTWYDKLLNAWKAGKTIWNPAYHVRNAISNQILSSMGTGKNLVSTTSDYIKAVREFRTGTSKVFKAAENAGLIGRQSFGTGLNELLDSAGLSSKALFRKIADKPRQLQNFTEETAKLNVFKTWMKEFAKKEGVSLNKALENNGLVKQAVDKAQQAIFSPYKISQAERSLVARKVPFYSFTRQAVPFTARTLVDNPKSVAVFGKIKDAIEGLSKDPRVKLPDYLKNQIRLGQKDKEGNPVYFDPTYIYPFGNFVETGLGKGQLPFGLSFDPFAMEVVQQLANKDFYFGNEIARSNIPTRRLGQRLAHLYRTVSPAALVTLTNTLYPALVGRKDSQGRNRNLGQAILSALGIKVSAPDVKNIQTQSIRSEQSKTRSIQSEIDQVLNDPNLTRSQKNKRIEELRNLTP